VDAVGDNLQLAITLLEQRAAGDYSPDETVQTFPAFADGRERRATGLDCWQLFEAFVKATKPADGTLNSGYLYLEVRCLGCNTNQTVALDVVRRPKSTPIHELERYMR
jgi:hypothetical protein